MKILVGMERSQWHRIFENEKVASAMNIVWSFSSFSVASLQKFFVFLAIFFLICKFVKDFPFVQNNFRAKITRQLAQLCRERGNPQKKKKKWGIRPRVFIYLGNFHMDWAVPSGFLTGIFGFRWQMANAPGLNYFLRMIDLKYFCEIDFRSRPCRGRSAIRGRIAIASLVQLKASWNHTLSYKKPWNAYKPTWDRKKASWIFWGRISEFIYCS